METLLIAKHKNALWWQQALLASVIVPGIIFNVFWICDKISKRPEVYKISQKISGLIIPTTMDDIKHQKRSFINNSNNSTMNNKIKKIDFSISNINFEPRKTIIKLQLWIIIIILILLLLFATNKLFLLILTKLKSRRIRSNQKGKQRREEKQENKK